MPSPTEALPIIIIAGSYGIILGKVEWFQYYKSISGSLCVKILFNSGDELILHGSDALEFQTAIKAL